MLATPMMALVLDLLVTFLLENISDSMHLSRKTWVPSAGVSRTLSILEPYLDRFSGLLRALRIIWACYLDFRFHERLESRTIAAYFDSLRLNKHADHDP